MVISRDKPSCPLCRGPVAGAAARPLARNAAVLIWSCGASLAHAYGSVCLAICRNPFDAAKHQGAEQRVLYVYITLRV